MKRIDSKEKLTDLEREVMAIVAKAGTISRTELRKQLFYKSFIQVSPQQLRTIQHSLLKKGRRIGSSQNRGIFHIRTQKDIKDALVFYYKLIKGIRANINKIEAIKLGQKVLKSRSNKNAFIKGKKNG